MPAWQAEARSTKRPDSRKIGKCEIRHKLGRGAMGHDFFVPPIGARK